MSEQRKKTDRIREAIESLREFGVPEDKIKMHLVWKFNITPCYAQNCLDADWEDED